jgi:hypothetical protein
MEEPSMLRWEDVPAATDDWREKTAEPARDIRRALSLIFVRSDLGAYWHPLRKQAAWFGRGFPTRQEWQLFKSALDRAVGAEQVQTEPLTPEKLQWGGWVKVAYSPTLRRTGELLNFFPGQLPGGYPNSPSPLAALLTSGLLGAGLGYGLGWAGEQVLPASFERGKLRKALALAGGTLGAIPGGLWSYSALQRGQSLRDGSDLSAPVGSRPDLIDEQELTDTLRKQSLDLCPEYLQAAARFAKRAYDIEGAFMPGFGGAGDEELPPTAIDVNINKLGQTLWEVGASPQTAASTMGAVYAAQQIPAPGARPGHASAHQLGLLGTMLGAAGGGAKGYLTGALIGKTLNVLTGAPVGLQNTLKQTGAVLGILNAVVPRLFH